MTSNIRDAIMEANRLARMRMGQEVPELVNIPSLEGIRAAQVPLTEAEAQLGMIRAATLDVVDNAAGIEVRNRAAIHSDVWLSLRDPDNVDTKIFKSIEEMNENLAPSDIDYLADNLMLLTSYASPAIDGLSDKALDELKKVFAETDWSALTGKRWAAVKLCISTLFPELLLAKSLGTGSIESST